MDEQMVYGRFTDKQDQAYRDKGRQATTQVFRERLVRREPERITWKQEKRQTNIRKGWLTNITDIESPDPQKRLPAVDLFLLGSEPEGEDDDRRFFRGEPSSASELSV